MDRRSSCHLQDEDSPKATQETSSQPSFAADEGVPVENRLCQLRDTVQSAALDALDCGSSQHQDWFDDKDAAISNLFAEENRLHKAYVTRPTDENKTVFHRSPLLV
ncbi:hypothetical protein SprV_0802511000 [Sparganum proliferum]